MITTSTYVEHKGRMYYVEATPYGLNVFRLRADWTHGQELAEGGRLWSEIVALAKDLQA